MVVVEVVTRYRGHKHLAVAGLLTDSTGRLFTLCRGTSAWTVQSWEEYPDHPILSTEEIRALPPCPACQFHAEEPPSQPRGGGFVMSDVPDDNDRPYIEDPRWLDEQRPETD